MCRVLIDPAAFCRAFSDKPDVLEGVVITAVFGDDSQHTEVAEARGDDLFLGDRRIIHNGECKLDGDGWEVAYLIAHGSLERMVEIMNHTGAQPDCKNCP